MNSQDHSSQASGGGVAEEAPTPRNKALVTQPAGMPAGVAAASPQTATDVMRGGMDAASLFHAFRRRWLLALGMGLLTGGAAAAALYFLIPASSSATATFLVKSNEDTVLEDLGPESSFETYRKTQIQWIQNQYVLREALKEPDVKASPLFADVDIIDRVDWLRDQLEVTFPQESEIMQIKLEGNAKPDELATVLNAVAKVYMDEVVFDERTRRLKPREILAISARKLGEEIKRKSAAYYALLQEGGNSGQYSSGVDPDTTMMIAQVRDLQRQKADAQNSLLQTQIQVETFKRQSKDPSLLEMQISQAIEYDPQMAALREQKMAMDYQISAMRGIYKNETRGTRALQAQAAGINQQIAQYEQELRSAMLNEQADAPNPTLAAMQKELQVKQQFLQQRITAAQTAMDEILEKLREKGRVNTDLELRAAEIQQLRSVQQRIAERIETWDIEAEAPNRVIRIEGVEERGAINTFARLVLSALGGVGTLGLVSFGIAYMEFRGRRLNGPEQVDEGLGIRVIGTLPSLSGRTKLDPNSPVVAQLTESIDSVRTALMHESTSSRRQLVMVTSAAEREGRTTVASQLAASLARAGRRTLLVDGDLRRPALHTLFDMPLEDGLCEVLRAETDVADVINPTHAEGLWLMTAGYCDADAVHALATDQAQPIFEKLRADYDFIIIDGAPVLGLSDSLLFGQHCDGAIMSVLRDYTNVPKIHQSSELLRSVGIQLMGAVVNGVPFKADRRVTHLQIAGSKSARKQLENAEA
ncbi:MAG: polysaccharide biosynthesis tyrosine autokinase [Planctomycetota bacterium]